MHVLLLQTCVMRIHVWLSLFMNSYVECLDHLVLSVYCFPSVCNCLLTPLMSVQDRKCNLID